MSASEVSTRIYYRLLFTLGGLTIALALAALLVETISGDATGAAASGFFLGVFTMKGASDVGAWRRERGRCV